MTFFQRISVGLKFLRQFGLRPLALFALYKLGLKSGYYKWIESKTNSSLTTHNSIFSLPPPDKLMKTLGEEGQAILLKEADEILDGKLRVFGELTPLRLAFDQSLKHWTGYENDPQLLCALCSPVSDIKYIWEPARFGWAFVLGRAYYITQDGKYAETFWKLFETFANANLPIIGPLWMNAQKVRTR